MKLQGGSEKRDTKHLWRWDQSVEPKIGLIESKRSKLIFRETQSLSVTTYLPRKTHDMFSPAEWERHCVWKHIRAKNRTRAIGSKWEIASPCHKLLSHRPDNQERRRTHVCWPSEYLRQWLYPCPVYQSRNVLANNPAHARARTRVHTHTHVPYTRTHITCHLGTHSLIINSQRPHNILELSLMWRTKFCNKWIHN